MYWRQMIFIILMMAGSTTKAANSLEELEQKAQQMMQQLETLQVDIQHQRSMQDTVDVSGSDTDQQGIQSTPDFVDLSAQEYTTVAQEQETHVLANPWWKNFEIHGFGATGFYDTGKLGTRDKAGFEIKEASLFLQATVWEDIAFFVELQTNRLNRDGDQFTRTGEVYVNFRDIPLTESTSAGMKLGRIDLPFGEEYLWQDAIDNPMIQNSVSWPYAYDEGIALYGEDGELHWIASVTDGLLFRGREENSDKAVNLKFYGDLTDSLYLSFSLMDNGRTSVSAMQFSGSFMQPIGGFGQPSTAGVSPSTEIDATLAEFDAKYHFSIFSSHDAYVWFALGAADIDDEDSSFSRNFRWFTIEPYVAINERWYGIIRYSEIGTYDDDEGYHFDGKIYAGGNAAFGYDTKRLKRFAIGLGWTPNPRVRGKLEISKDKFDLIDASVLPNESSGRTFVGLEVAIGF